MTKKGHDMLQMLSNGYDVVIAESIEDAREILINEFGISYDETEGDGWRIYAPDEEFALAVEADDEPFVRKETKLVSEWISESGRGFFGTTEY